MLLRELCQTLNEIAPVRLAESWDNVGLLVGDESASVERVMTCLTITEASLDEAIAELCVAVGAEVVDGKHLAVHAEQRNVLALWRHGDARTFKQIGLGGHVGPLGFLGDHLISGK